MNDPFLTSLSVDDADVALLRRRARLGHGLAAALQQQSSLAGAGAAAPPSAAWLALAQTLASAASAGGAAAAAPAAPPFAALDAQSLFARLPGEAPRGAALGLKPAPSAWKWAPSPAGAGDLCAAEQVAT